MVKKTGQLDLRWRWGIVNLGQIFGLNMPKVRKSGPKILSFWPSFETEQESSYGATATSTPHFIRC